MSQIVDTVQTDSTILSSRARSWEHRRCHLRTGTLRTASPAGSPSPTWQTGRGLSCQRVAGIWRCIMARKGHHTISMDAAGLTNRVTRLRKIRGGGWRSFSPGRHLSRDASLFPSQSHPSSRRPSTRAHSELQQEPASVADRQVAVACSV